MIDNIAVVLEARNQEGERIGVPWTIYLSIEAVTEALGDNEPMRIAVRDTFMGALRHVLDKAGDSPNPERTGFGLIFDGAIESWEPSQL